MLQEKRSHERVKASCSFAINVNGVVCKGTTRNVSMGGVLARIDQGEIEKYQDGDEGMCRVFYQGKGVTFACTILRVAGQDIALIFFRSRL